MLSCAEQIAANAAAAEIDAHLSVYPEKVHGWMLLPHLPATVAAVDEITTWIADQLERPRSDHSGF